MNFWRVAALTIATAMFSTSPAGACTCSPLGPPCEAFSLNDAVFVGQVIAVQSYDRPAQIGGESIMLAQNRFTFDVQKVYRGELDARVDVVTGRGGGDCGYRFVPGVTYLVYAGGQGAVLSASKCSRTRPLEYAQNDIAWLEMSRTLPAGATIFGKVRQSLQTDGLPLAGVSITIRDSAGQERNTVTDTNGSYSFSGLEAGKYFISPERPSTLFFSSGERIPQSVRADVYDRGCAEVNFNAVANGRIRGHVFDENGPAANVTVSAGWKDTLTLPDGSYEISGLPAGKYIVVVNPSGPDTESPYLRRFYPDTAEIHNASPIEVGEAEEVSAIEFRLTHKLTPVVLEVQVVDPDGKPFKGAYALAHYPRTSPEILRGTTTGSDGISRLSLLAERVYAISARTTGEIFRCSGPVAVYPGRSGRITLKLGPPVPPGGEICRFSLGN